MPIRGEAIVALKDFFNSDDIDLLKGLNQFARGYLLFVSDVRVLKKGEALVEEGDDALDYVYLIYKGNVEILKEGEKVAVQGEKDCIGEMITLTVDKKRLATVKVISDEALFVCIPYSAFEAMKATLPDEFMKLQNNMLDISWKRFQ